MHININTVNVGSSFRGPEQSGSQWRNTDHRYSNDVRDGLQDLNYLCQEYLERRQKVNLLTLILSVAFGIVIFLEFFVSLYMVLIHLHNVRRVKRNERKELKKQFLEAKQELDAFRNAKNQPKEQEGKEMEGPNEKILNQRRMDHLNLLIEKHLNEKLHGIIVDQTRQQDMLRMNQIKTNFAFAENPQGTKDNPLQ